MQPRDQGHSQTAVDAANTTEQAELQPQLQSKPSRYIPLRLNRNFMNYPLARDARTIAVWRKDDEGDWYTLCPGEDRIGFWLPKDTVAGARRLPTGFDMNVL